MLQHSCCHECCNLLLCLLNLYLGNPVCDARFQRPILKEESTTLNLPPRLLRFHHSVCRKCLKIMLHKTLDFVLKFLQWLNEQCKELYYLSCWSENSVSCKKRKGIFESPVSGMKYCSTLMFRGRFVMFTAGNKLTSSVDPKRDVSVALRKVRTFKAVFVLKPAVGRLFWRRGTRGDISDTVVVY